MITTGCATAKTGEAGDAQIAQNAKAAQAAYQSGAFVRAARFYELGLARARALDSGGEIGRTAYNAAACWLRAGEPSNAVPLLVEADREVSRSSGDREPVLVLQSKAAAALKDFSAASAFASNAMAAAKSDGQRFEVTLLFFEEACQRGDVATAEALASAVDRGARGATTGLQAEAADATGRLAAMQRKFDQAADSFDRAAELWRKAGSVHEMAVSLSSAASAFGSAGKSGEAADRFYRAARSFFGQNDHVAALTCIDAAMKSAETAKSAALQAQIRALFAQIKNAVEAQ